MNEQPFFSVITPVYNREEIVVDTILSVLNQQFSNFEYIVVNDASTDQTVDVLMAFSKQDSRIQVLNFEENQGRCSARNAGLEAAQGNWICYLDSDDVFYPNHLKTFFDLIQNNPSDKAFAVDQHINGALKQYRRKALHAEQIRLNINDFIEDNPLTANQLCHHRELEINWSQERIPISEDWLFMRELALKTAVLKTGKVTTNLIDHKSRSMNTTNPSKFVEFNLLAANRFISDNVVSNSIKSRVESYTLVLCTNVFLKHREKKKAFKLFRKCMLKPRAYGYLLFYKAIIKFFL